MDDTEKSGVEENVFVPYAHHSQWPTRDLNTMVKRNDSMGWIFSRGAARGRTNLQAKLTDE